MKNPKSVLLINFLSANGLWPNAILWDASSVCWQVFYKTRNTC